MCSKRCRLVCNRAEGLSNLQARQAGAFGVSVGEVTVDFGKVMERMRALRAGISPNDSCERFQHQLGIDVCQVQSCSLACMHGLQTSFLYVKACMEIFTINKMRVLCAGSRHVHQPQHPLHQRPDNALQRCCGEAPPACCLASLRHTGTCRPWPCAATQHGQM